MPHSKIAETINAQNSDSIRTVGRESAQLLGDITADAFRHDPFNNWLFRHHQNKHRMFSLFAKHVYARRGLCQILHEEGEALAASMWMLPGCTHKLPLALYPLMGANFARDDGLTGIKRGLASGDAMDCTHPKEPHVYLFTVGVASAGRGRGLGRRLIQPVLDACDQHKTMVYLENSNPANSRFYQSLGFETVQMIEPIAGCPRLEAMKRPA